MSTDPSVGGVGSNKPIPLPTPMDVDAAAPLAPIKQDKAIVDAMAKADATAVGWKRKRGENDAAEGLPPPKVFLDGDKTLHKLNGAGGTANPHFKKSYQTATRMAMELAVSQQAENRRESREASLELALMALDEQLAGAEFIRLSGEVQSEIVKNQALQHMTNGFIAVGSALMSLGTFAATKWYSGRVQKKDSELQTFSNQKSFAQKDYDQSVRNNDPPAVQATKKDTLNRADQAYSNRSSALMQQSTVLTQTVTSTVQQAANAAKEFTEAATGFKEADLTKKKAMIDSFMKIAETYEKLAQKMSQTAEADSKEAADQIAKILQALDQIVSQGYKAFNIGVHG